MSSSSSSSIAYDSVELIDLETNTEWDLSNVKKVEDTNTETEETDETVPYIMPILTPARDEHGVAIPGLLRPHKDFLAMMAFMPKKTSESLTKEENDLTHHTILRHDNGSLYYMENVLGLNMSRVLKDSDDLLLACSYTLETDEGHREIIIVQTNKLLDESIAKFMREQPQSEEGEEKKTESPATESNGPM